MEFNAPIPHERDEHSEVQQLVAMSFISCPTLSKNHEYLTAVENRMLSIISNALSKINDSEMRKTLPRLKMSITFCHVSHGHTSLNSAARPSFEHVSSVSVTDNRFTSMVSFADIIFMAYSASAPASMFELRDKVLPRVAHLQRACRILIALAIDCIPRKLHYTRAQGQDTKRGESLPTSEAQPITTSVRMHEEIYKAWCAGTNNSLLVLSTQKYLMSWALHPSQPSPSLPPATELSRLPSSSFTVREQSPSSDRRDLTPKQRPRRAADRSNSPPLGSFRSTINEIVTPSLAMELCSWHIPLYEPVHRSFAEVASQKAQRLLWLILIGRGELTPNEHLYSFTDACALFGASDYFPAFDVLWRKVRAEGEEHFFSQQFLNVWKVQELEITDDVSAVDSRAKLNAFANRSNREVTMSQAPLDAALKFEVHPQTLEERRAINGAQRLVASERVAGTRSLATLEATNRSLRYTVDTLSIRLVQTTERKAEIARLKAEVAETKLCISTLIKDNTSEQEIFETGVSEGHATLTQWLDDQSRLKLLSEQVEKLMAVRIDLSKEYRQLWDTNLSYRKKISDLQCEARRITGVDDANSLLSCEACERRWRASFPSQIDINLSELRAEEQSSYCCRFANKYQTSKCKSSNITTPNSHEAISLESAQLFLANGVALTHATPEPFENCKSLEERLGFLNEKCYSIYEHSDKRRVELNNLLGSRLGNELGLRLTPGINSVRHSMDAGFFTLANESPNLVASTFTTSLRVFVDTVLVHDLTPTIDSLSDVLSAYYLDEKTLDLCERERFARLLIWASETKNKSAIMIRESTLALQFV